MTYLFLSFSLSLSLFLVLFNSLTFSLSLLLSPSGQLTERLTDWLTDLVTNWQIKTNTSRTGGDNQYASTSDQSQGGLSMGGSIIRIDLSKGAKHTVRSTPSIKFLWVKRDENKELVIVRKTLLVWQNSSRMIILGSGWIMWRGREGERVNEGERVCEGERRSGRKGEIERGREEGWEKKKKREGEGEGERKEAAERKREWGR